MGWSIEVELYRIRHAASNVQDKVKVFMTRLEFRVGRYNACTFWQPDANLNTMVHGDDFTSFGRNINLRWLKVEFDENFELKLNCFGTSKDL